MAPNILIPIEGTDFWVRREPMRVRAGTSRLPIPKGALAKIALGLAAFRFQRGVYHPAFDPLREVVSGCEPAETLRIEYFGVVERNELAPEHAVRLELGKGCLLVDILFFKRFRFAITLTSMPHEKGGIGAFYVEDVAKGGAYLNIDLDDFDATRRLIRLRQS